MKNLIILLLSFISTTAFSAEFKLIDALSGEWITNAKVIIRHGNTIRCATVPCPSNERDDEIKSDATGKITYNLDPSSEDAKNYSVRVQGYQAQNYFKVQKTSELGSYLELKPMSIDATFRLAVIKDKETKKSIQNQEIWIADTKECREQNCKNILFKGKTNRLGNIFYVFKTVFPLGLSQMDPVWIFVKGYEPYVRHHHHTNEVLLERPFEFYSN